MLSKTESINIESILWKVIQFPLTRIVLAAVFVTLGVVVTQLVISQFGSLASSPAISMLSIVIALVAVYISYRLSVQWIEKRQVTELSANGAVKEFCLGLLLGSGIITTVIGVLWKLGIYQVSGFNPWLVLLPAASANIPSGFVQEILFRGILFRITEESLGTWIAMIISSMLFGLIHIFSVGATVFSTVSIMLEAGTLLATAYILTKRLWLAIGIHIGWDFAIDGIYGVGSSALSGSHMHGLLQARLIGSDLLTGGQFGVEVSIIAFAIALSVGAFLTVKARNTGKFINPIWILNQKNK
jgi:membrane protease YdiL (CAAX protease family)